jgi:DNA repair protein RecN (Recombination protein N)
MLHHLHVRNLAVVDEIEVELTQGLTVLTGETGAGKSILVDALGLALGERADSDAVRPGAPRAEISASFLLPAASPASKWLCANDLDADDSGEDSPGSTECVLRRVVTAEGRSRGYINGNPAPMQTLRELGAMLVDICGQQAHQSLGKTENQRLLLDQHGGHSKLVDDLRETHRTWQALQKEYEELDGARADQATRIDLLQFQVQELEALNAQPGELETLDKAQRLAANASRIQEDAGAALQMLYENEQASAYDLTSRARAHLERLGELDPKLAELAGMLGEAELQISEAADSLRHYLDNKQTDGGDLNELEARLGAMHDMARKHRINAAELPELTERLRSELHKIEHADDTLEELQQRVGTKFAELTTLAKKLTGARKRAAKSLSQQVSKNMQQLGMPEGTFSIGIEELETPGPAGAERIEFLVAINPGMQAGALTKVASGGELSRVSLAIQVAASDQANTPTLIFDEVDAGVGGGTADIVGEKLRSLAASSQVLCVTHLAQVASKGHQQFRVSKLSDGKITRTIVSSLTSTERVEELARMLGGVKITERTRDHAAEMLTVGNG